MAQKFEFEWRVTKGLGMSSRVSATGHITDTLPLVGKSRASCPGGRSPIFNHQVGPNHHRTE